MIQRFRYHFAFLPEYVSTVFISLMVTWLIVVCSMDKPFPTAGKPHLVPSVITYILVALSLIGLTLYHRFKHCTILVAENGIEGSFWGMRLFSTHFSEVAGITQQSGRFFGRPARMLHLRTRHGQSIRITDFIFGYEELKRLVSKGSKTEIQNIDLSERQIERLKSSAAKRQQLFGRPRPINYLLRLPERVVCLLPVAFVDFVISLYLIYEVFHKGRSDYRSSYVLYSGTVALAIAAFVARYVYYCLFSSAALRR